MNYTLYDDGSFDIVGSYIRICHAYPAINGQAVHPVKIEVEKDSVIYHLGHSRIHLVFALNKHRLSISCLLYGMAGIHDVEIIGPAIIEGAEKVFVQGFGMEGPSGIYQITDEIPVSHGITALCNKDGCLLAYTEDHRRFSTCFQTADMKSLFDNRFCFSCAINLEGTARETDQLPTLYLQESNNLSAGLTDCATRIAKEMHARRIMPPAFHWCSWYYQYQNMDQATLEEYCQAFREEDEIPFRYIQIDAGYCPSLGDWLLPNHRFPEGLKKAAETILTSGYQAGIWIGPYMVGDQSLLYNSHPDWVIKDLEGQPLTMIKSYTEPKVWGNRDSNYYVLDASNPEVLEYLKEVFTSLRNWGFTFFKTDFMLWGMQDSSQVQRYNPDMTSVEIMRKVLDVIRGAIGEESYLLGCIAPYMPFIGYADGMRIAGDVGAQWKDTFGPVNLIREVCADNYFQNIYWQNDPDSVLLRDFETMLTPNETRSLALLQAMSGGVITTSDPVHRIAEDRKQLLRFIKPEEKTTPEVPFLAHCKEELVLLQHLEQGCLLYILNPTEKEITTAFALDKLLSGNNWYQYRYSWEEDEIPEPMQSDLCLERIAPHDSVLLFLTKEPLRSKPSNLWQW